MPIDIDEIPEKEEMKEKKSVSKSIEQPKRKFDWQKLKFYANCLAFNDLTTEAEKLKKKDSFVFFDKEQNTDRVISDDNMTNLRTGIDVGVDWIINHSKEANIVDIQKCPSEKDILKEVNEQEDFKMAIKSLNNAKCMFLNNIQGFAFFPSSKEKYRDTYGSKTMQSVKLNKIMRVGVLTIAGRGEKFSEPEGIIKKLKDQYKCNI